MGQLNLKDASFIRKTVREAEKKTFDVKAAIVHPTYVAKPTKDDIALINIDGNFKWSEYVRPVCLPNSVESSFSGRLATVAGWGWTDEVLNGKFYLK